MRFEEAIKFGKATLDGSGYVLFDEDGVLIDNNGVKQYYDKEYLTGTDWDIYEEPKKTLSEKEHYLEYEINTYDYFLKKYEVKEALKEYLHCFKKQHPTEEGDLFTEKQIIDCLKEKFGEELLK